MATNYNGPTSAPRLPKPKRISTTKVVDADPTLEAASLNTSKVFSGNLASFLRRNPSKRKKK